MDNKEIQLKNALKETEALTKAIQNTKKKTNPKNIKKNMRQKSIIGAILLLILVLTGTFAWQSYQQRAINPFYDPSGNHGVRFHDRLELEDPTLTSGDARFGYANMVNPNLNIFAENFGDMDVFVRIQLREFLAIHEDPDPNVIPNGIGGALRNNPDTWPIFRTSDTNINQPRYDTVAYEIGHEGIIVNLGQENPISFIPTFNRAVQPVDPAILATNLVQIPSPFNHTNAFLMSEAVGAAVDWFTNYTDATGGGLVTAEVTNNHIRDYIMYGIPTGPGITDNIGDPLTPEDRRNLDAGLATGPTVTAVESYRLYTYLNTANEVELILSPNYYTHIAQQTQDWYIDTDHVFPTGQALPADFRGVMTLSQWNLLGRPQGEFWIHDSQDPNGWFYWMGYLYQGLDPESDNPIVNATSLLVESLNLPDNPLHWEYALHMYGQAFTRPSLDLVQPAITTGNNGAIQIFESVVPTETRPLGGTITVAADGVITISDGLADVNMADFVAVPNSLGSRQSTLPSEATDLNLINIEGPGITSGDFTGTFVPVAGGHAVRITQNILPAAAIGCYWQGTPSNLWTDSTGTEWCHVAAEGPYSMLISRHAHQMTYITGSGLGTGIRNHEQNVFVRWPEATNVGAANDGPEIRQHVNAWWSVSGTNAYVSPLLRGAAVHATLPIYRTEVLQTNPSLYDAMHDETAVATPIPGSSNGLPFFLSNADLNARLTSRRGPTTTAGAASWIPDSSLISRSPGNTFRHYWLRDPGCQGPGPTSASCAGATANTASATLAVADVGSDGNRLASHANSTWWALGFRPAV